MKSFISVNGQKFFIHPIYAKYAANTEGEIIHVKLRKLRQGKLTNTGYLMFSIYLEKNKIKCCLCHRFVYECFYGLIEKNNQINHINSIRTDNRIKNLESVSASENCGKAAINKGFGYYRKNPKKVKAINLFTKKETNFNSLYSAEKMLGIKRAQISMICQGGIQCKTAKSKVDGCKYIFRYLVA